jgi:hypothetical protein
METATKNNYASAIERTAILEQTGFMAIIKSLPESKNYIQYMNDNDLSNPFPVFTERNYEWRTAEYKAMLLFDLHFAAKSPDQDIAEDSLRRFIHVLNKYQVR